MKTGIDLINDINNCKSEKGTMAFWWLGQIGYAVKLGDKILYIDAFLTNYPDRTVPPIISPTELTNADYILGTHDHIDHIDREAWHQLSLSSPNAKFVVPKILAEKLSEELGIPKERFIGLDDGLDFSDGEIKITGIPAAHEFLDRDIVSGCYPYLGYVIEANGYTLYHAGDTCIYEGMYARLRKWEKVNLMFIPINGRDARRYNLNYIGNMTYQEAVDLAGTFKPDLVVPGHYEMFTINSEDPLLFAEYLKAKYPDVKYWIGEHGERVILK